MKRILIIEDDTEFAYLFTLALRGAERITVGTLADAITRLSCEKWDVVICDLQLPDSTPERTLAEVSLRRGTAALAVVTGAVDELPTNCDAAEHKINLSLEREKLAFVHRAERNAEAVPDYKRNSNALTAFVNMKVATA